MNWANTLHIPNIDKDYQITFFTTHFWARVNKLFSQHILHNVMKGELCLHLNIFLVSFFHFLLLLMDVVILVIWGVYENLFGVVANIG
jgi:hypothetical protein